MSAHATPTLKLYLYGRETCHLCHDMWADVRVFLQKNACVAELIWRDIDEDADWQSEFALRIPVLTDADERIICEGRLDTQALAQTLAQAYNRQKSS